MIKKTLIKGKQRKKLEFELSRIQENWGLGSVR